jgi:phospholipid transport system substrate-binding protein
MSALAMSVFLTAGALASAAPTPTETVKSAIATVVGILNDPIYQQAGMTEARRNAIEQVVRSFVSEQDMVRYTLGTRWTDLSASDQRHFKIIFVRLLRDAVACRVNEYVNADVLYLAEQVAGNRAEVRILFKGDKVDTLLTVRLVNRSGAWRMYDAIADGVSLAENYRSQFLQVMRATSYVGLVSTMEAQTMMHKSFEHTVELAQQ